MPLPSRELMRPWLGIPSADDPEGNADQDGRDYQEDAGLDALEVVRDYRSRSNQPESEERAPSPRSQEMTFSCWVPSPLAASSGVPCA